MAIKIRPLTDDDIGALERTEKAITKSPRTSSLGRHVREQLKHGDPKACLAAEVDGKFAGFIIGDVRPWEFGTDRDVGWVKVVGVEPAFQGRGVGKALGEALLGYFRGRGVERVRTLIEWHAGDMIAYFKALGFDRSDHITLERGAS